VIGSIGKLDQAMVGGIESSAASIGSHASLVVVATVLRVEGYRFFFWSNEGQEPEHIHVEYGEGTAKFWLDPVALVESYRMKSQELKRARELVEANIAVLREAWNVRQGA
jgi:hypothetical protein